MPNIAPDQVMDSTQSVTQPVSNWPRIRPKTVQRSSPWVHHYKSGPARRDGEAIRTVFLLPYVLSAYLAITGDN
jgi:hypothetical protein